MKISIPHSLTAALFAFATSPVLLAAGPAVKGVFNGNDKPAKMAFVSARKGEPFADKETTILVFTEKDHSKEKRPDIKAGFGDFGSALIITVHPDGKIIGCEVAHAAHEKKPFSSIGTLQMSDFKIEGGEIKGKLSTGGKTDTFKQTWEVDLTFHTKAP